MSPQQPKTFTFPFPPALLVIDSLAMAAIAVCLAELFPKHGNAPGLIPQDWIWPILAVSAVIAIICGIVIAQIVLQNKTDLSAGNIDR